MLNGLLRGVGWNWLTQDVCIRGVCGALNAVGGGTVGTAEQNEDSFGFPQRLWSAPAACHRDARERLPGDSADDLGSHPRSLREKWYRPVTCHFIGSLGMRLWENQYELNRSSRHVNAHNQRPHFFL